MGVKGLAAAGAAVAALWSSAAAAQDGAGVAPNRTEGFYVALRGGLASLEDVDITYRDEGGTFGGTGATDTLETTVDSKNAFAFGGALGYDFGPVRADVEVDYARNKLSSLTIRRVNGAAVTSISAADGADFCDYAELDGCSVSGATIRADGGHVRQLSALANLWVDLPIGDRVTGYVGGGVGVGGFETADEGKARFAWQVGAGAAFHLSPVAAITGDFRYRSIGGATFTDSDFPDYALRVGQLKTSTASVGLRFTF